MNDVTRREVVGLAALAAVGAASMLQGCSSDDGPGGQGSQGGQGPDAPDQVELKLATVGGLDPMMEFAANTTAAVTGGGENVCFSPASLYLDLGLLGVGAVGAVQKETLRALCTDSEEDLAAELRQATDDLKLEPLVKATDLHVASSVWTDADCPATQEFVARAEEVADAQAMTVSFGTAQANAAMTKWVSDQTQGLLQPQFETQDPAGGSGTAMTLLNTVYVKPRWASPFSSEDNVTEEFTLADGSKQADVEFMCQTATQSVLVGDGCVVAAREFEVDVSSLYEAAESAARDASGGDATGAGGSDAGAGPAGAGVDYAAVDAQVGKCQCRMAFLLPDEGTALTDVLTEPDDWAAFFTAECEERREVHWKLPKMDFGTDFDLVGVLRSLGMEAVFAPSEDFREMVVPPEASMGEYVSEVRQGTHLTLDEEGVEAAAFTSIGIKATSMMPEEIEELDFFCNRPFAFALFVGERVLFTGVFVQPKSR